MVFLAKCTFTLGHTTRAKDGNIIEEIPAKCELDHDGDSVAVGVLDDDTMEQVGDAELYGDFDPWGYLSEALKLLAPKRAGNIPDFESYVKKKYREYRGDGCPFSDYCESINCVDCIVHRWMEEADEA